MEKRIDHAARARELFLEGYNCAQSVFAAFCDVTGMDEATALKLSSSFGGGMGRMREVCGACSGMFMVVGMLCGYDVPGDDEIKKAHYARIQELAVSFKEKNGTIICRDLLDGIETDSLPTPTPRTEAYYQERPCVRFVGDAAAIVEAYLFPEEENA